MKHRSWTQNQFQLVEHERNSDDPSEWEAQITSFKNLRHSKLKLTPDRLVISSLILSSFWWPTHGQTPASPPLPDWSLMKASCSLLNSPRIDCNDGEKSNDVCHQQHDAKWLTLSLTVSFILAPALLTTPEKNDPKDFAPAVTLLVTKARKWKKYCIIHSFIIRFFITVSNHSGLLFRWWAFFWNGARIGTTSCTRKREERGIRKPCAS